MGKLTNKAKDNRQLAPKLQGVVRPTGIVYGYFNGFRGLRTASITVKGRPRLTGVTIRAEGEEVVDTVWWAGGVVGLAESHFPKPTEWNARASKNLMRHAKTSLGYAAFVHGYQVPIHHC